jgi:hypothetical protein
MQGHVQVRVFVRDRPPVALYHGDAVVFPGAGTAGAQVCDGLRSGRASQGCIFVSSLYLKMH